LQRLGAKHKLQVFSNTEGGPAHPCLAVQRRTEAGAWQGKGEKHKFLPIFTNVELN